MKSSSFAHAALSFVHYGDTVTSIGGNVEQQGSVASNGIKH